MDTSDGRLNTGAPVTSPGVLKNLWLIAICADEGAGVGIASFPWKSRIQSRIAVLAFAELVQEVIDVSGIFALRS